MEMEMIYDMFDTNKMFTTLSKKQVIIFSSFSFIMIGLYLSFINNHCNSVYWGQSKIPNAGRGVFAFRHIKKNEIVDSCPYVIGPGYHISGIFYDYVMDGSVYDRESVIFPLGLCGLYNHNDSPNVQFHDDEHGQDVLNVVASRAILKGEELFIDYGNDFWQDRYNQR
eukprot:GHVL01004637.1.p2 GENE.GHVL01004637.1~~GHVL01004637.1.p2  ORF type:complete len:176 (-),score=15.40 GHVL01004637.1:1429-1932(-)